MSTSLHDRLADLAADAPPGSADPGLWDRGVRYHRRRRLGTAAIALVVVVGLVAIGALDWWRARPEPMPAGGTPALPTRIWTPSPWLPGTGEAGPPGQLAAVQYAERKGWTGTDPGVVGISAATGEYRFLDLPDAHVADGVALSPDGRRVAYWTTGQTRRSPNSAHGPVTGVAVYDTATGEVARHEVPTDHGLSVEDLVWADPDRLVFSHLQWRAGDGGDDMLQSSANEDSGLLVWKPGAGGAPVAIPKTLGWSIEQSTGQGQLLLTGEGMRFLDLDRPELMRTVVLPRDGYMRVAAVDVDGTRVAWPRGNRNPNTIAYGEVVDGERVDFTDVPDSKRTFAVVAWLDQDHVAAIQRPSRSIGPGALMSVDVRTGEASEIVRFPSDTYGNGTEVATGLLDTPSVDRPKPPRPLDPRVVTTGLVLVTGAGVLALLAWRRRVRP